MKETSGDWFFYSYYVIDCNGENIGCGHGIVPGNTFYNITVENYLLDVASKANKYTASVHIIAFNKI